MSVVECQRGRSMFVVLLVYMVFINCFRSAASQNSINPRRSKANHTNGVLECPKVEGIVESECKMPCLRDEHCENYGDLKCCPAVTGSKCKAECKEPVLNPNGGGTCYDFEVDRQYAINDVFVSNGVCCRCDKGGKINCTAVKSCMPGCYYGSTYYNNDMAISRSLCRNCSCHNGTVSCKWNTNCTQEKCKYKGKIYTLEHIIRLDHGCKECVCQYRGWSCIAITCNAERSSSLAVAIGSSMATSCLAVVLMLRFLYS